MYAVKGGRYKVIFDSHNFFKPGEIVVALETSPVPYCIREEEYVPGRKPLAYDNYHPLKDDELEMLDDQPFI